MKTFVLILIISGRSPVVIPGYTDRSTCETVAQETVRNVYNDGAYGRSGKTYEIMTAFCVEVR